MIFFFAEDKNKVLEKTCAWYSEVLSVDVGSQGFLIWVLKKRGFMEYRFYSQFSWMLWDIHGLFCVSSSTHQGKK